jgi:hypothetical protein
MKKNIISLIFSLFVVFVFNMAVSSCRTSSSGKGNPAGQMEELTLNQDGEGLPLQLSFVRGKSFNHPTFVIWMEDTEGNFIQTLYVTRSYGSGTFTYGDATGGEWKPGQVRRPAALPYWSHKAGAALGLSNYITDSARPMPDALTSATPKGNFLLKTKGENKHPEIVKIMLEINQTWDWNPFWTNNKYPDDQEYKTSCQPAVVYAATVDLSQKGSAVEMKPVGRSSHSGADGKLYSDLETLTTALNIAEKISVVVSE